METNRQGQDKSIDSIQTLYYERIKQFRNSENTVKLNKLSRLYGQFYKNKQKIIYLKDHKKFNIVPKHVMKGLERFMKCYDNNHFPKERNTINCFNNFTKKLVQLEINFLYKKEKMVLNNIIKFEKEFKNLGDANAEIILKVFEEMKNEMKNVSKAPNQRKINRNKMLYKKSILYDGKNRAQTEALEYYQNLHKNNWFINLTGKDFPVNIQNFLSLGPNFNLNKYTNNKHFKRNIMHMISELENIYSILNTSDNHKNAIRNKINNLLTNFILKSKNSNCNRDKLDNIITQDAMETKKFLKNNPNVYLIKSDKSNLVVAILEEEYKSKLNEILDDETIYTRIEENKIQVTQRKVKKYINKLIDLNYINKNNKELYLNENSNVAKMYGLIKLHKPNKKLRPIVDMSQNPTEKLAKMFNKTLENLNSKNNFDCKNTIDIKNKLEDIILENNDILVSLDVESLFTNIPIIEVIKILEKKWDFLEQFTHIKDKDVFLEGIKLCCENSMFKANNFYYKQIDGTPMGGSLSCSLSGIFLNKLLSDTLKKTKIPIKIMCKYIDDLFLIIDKNHVDRLLNNLNNYHPNIKFTIEKEIQNRLDYLNITIIKGDKNELEFKWLNKKEKNNKYLNYYSNHPKNQIINAAKNMIENSIKLTSKKHLKDTKCTVYNKLKMNGYPQSLINKIWFQAYKKLTKHADLAIVNNDKGRKEKVQSTQKGDKVIFQGLTYIPTLSENIQSIFHNYDAKEIKFGFKISNKVNNFLTKVKDKTDCLDKSNIIYSIPCGKCDTNYVGESKNKLGKRIKQHVYDVKSKTGKTALFMHSASHSHNFDFEKTIILDYEKHKNKRKILENIYINENLSNTCNFKTSLSNINQNYSNILKII